MEIVYEAEAQPFPRMSLSYVIFCFWGYRCYEKRLLDQIISSLLYKGQHNAVPATVEAFGSLSHPNNPGHFAFNSGHLSGRTESRLAAHNATSLTALPCLMSVFWSRCSWEGGWAMGWGVKADPSTWLKKPSWNLSVSYPGRSVSSRAPPLGHWKDWTTLSLGAT